MKRSVSSSSQNYNNNIQQHIIVQHTTYRRYNVQHLLAFTNSYSHSKTMTSRRDKRSVEQHETKSAVSSALGMTQAQFSSMILISIASSHCLDIYRSSLQGTETSYCDRYFAYAHNGESDENQTLSCTESDIAILTLKYQTTAMRMVLSFLITIICWSKESLLKTWNYASLISPLGTSVLGLLYHKQTKILAAPEVYSLGAIMVLFLTTNYYGREDRRPLNVKEGLDNVVLLILTSLMSYWISNHILGAEHYLVFEKGDITDGGRALWNMMIGVEYVSFMFASTFSLFYLDPLRRRVSSSIDEMCIFVFHHIMRIFYCIVCSRAHSLSNIMIIFMHVYIIKQTTLVFMAILMLLHAFYQLPLQKDIWKDPSERQTTSMMLFFAFMAGAVIPSLDFSVKK